MDIYESYFTEHLRLFPVAATFLGDHRWDDRFENVYSAEHQSRHRAMLCRYLSRLPRRSGDDLEVEAFRYALEMELESFAHPLHLLPLSQMHNVFLDMTEVVLNHQVLGTASDLEALRRRMREFHRAAHTQIERLKEGMNARIVLPRVVAEQVVEQLQTLLRDRPYTTRSLPQRLARGVRDVMESTFTPALRRTIAFLRETYLPACRETVGCAALPGGVAMYDYLVRRNTTLRRVSVAALHRVGVRETARIAAEKKALAATLPIKDLKNGFVKSSRREVLGMYRAQQRRIAARVLPDNFGDLHPRHDYVVKAVPRHEEASQSTAYYVAPSMDGRRPGAFYVNLRNLSEHPSHKAEVLSLHEGSPGHHFQIALAMEGDTPKYRVHGGWDAYVEGWGLYVEGLGEYADGYGRLGKYDYELMRAIRLIVDTGLHRMGWSAKRCRDMFRRLTDMTDSEIDAEIHRYIAMPGQALSYKVGELHILDARRRYLEGRADVCAAVREFHHRVLAAGPLPLWLLDKVLTDSAPSHF